MQHIKSDLSSLFSIKDLGPIHHILGISVTKNSSDNSFTLSNSALIVKYAESFKCIPPNNVCRLPSILPCSKLSTTDNANPFTAFKSLKLFTTHEYMSRIGALGYLVKRTRPDLVAVTGYLARRQCNFTLEDYINLQRVLTYLYLTLPVQSHL